MLVGSRITLRAPTLDDAEPIFERIASDPEVSRYMSWRPHADVGETRRVITEVFNLAGETSWLVQLHGDGVIGMCGWRRPRPHIVDFGYCLGRRWWGQGLMTEAVGLLLDKARRDPTVYRFSAYCHVDNDASVKVLRRAGLELEGRLRRYAVLPNMSPDPQDCLLFATAVR